MTVITTQSAILCLVVSQCDMNKAGICGTSVCYVTSQHFVLFIGKELANLAVRSSSSKQEGTFVA